MIAPRIQADADDSARVVLTLNLLGRPAKVEPVVSDFRTKSRHFCTYPGERNASFSANCNILMAILHAPDRDKYDSDIVNILEYLCDCWWNGAIKDKWVSATIVGENVWLLHFGLTYSRIFPSDIL